MKRKICLFLFCCCFPLFAEKGSWNFNLTNDVVYYPFCDFIPGETHFSKISGPLDTAAIRITGQANYVIPTPLGNHWLLSDAHVTIQPSLQIVPVTMRSINKIIFTPFPFLEFEAGTSLGIGWNIGNIKGLTSLNEETKQYENLNTFSHYYYDFWFMGTFQFDTGAVIPGDWTHVVMLAQYQVIYKGITGLKDTGIYNWQTIPGQVKGLQYDTQVILAYQMPIVLYRAGIMTEFTAHYDGKDYGSFDENYDGDFTTILLSPFLQFKFENEDTLSVLCQFSNRRSFIENHKKLTEEMYLTKIGDEWFVNMFAVSWTHYF